MECLSLEEAVIKAQLVKSTVQISSPSVEDVKMPVDKIWEECQQTCKEEIPLTSDTKVSLSLEPGSDAQLIETTSLVLPTSVKEEQKLQLPIKNDIPINFSTENPSFQEAVTDTRLSSSSDQILPIVDKNQEEPQQSCKEEIPLILDNKALSLQPMSEAQLMNTATMALPTSVKSEEKPQLPIIKVVKLNAENPSFLEAVTDTQLLNTSSCVSSTLNKNKVELQQTCKEEIPFTLDTKPSLSLAPVNDSHLMQTATWVSPVQVKVEPGETCRDELSATDNKTGKQVAEVVPMPKDCKTVGTSTEDLEKELPFECHNCGKCFLNERILSIHQRFYTYNSTKPYSCKYCKMSFSDSNKLLIHIRRHTGEKPYECSICGKSFIDLFSCRVHIRTHTGEKPYECSVCSKRFTQPSNLTSHMKTHSSERPYQCDICQSGFMRLNILTRHRNTHEVLKKRTKKVQKNKNNEASRYHQSLEPCTKIKKIKK